VSELEL
jgi:hypothetical protein